MNHPPLPAIKRQKGAAALAASLALLFGMTLILFFANRSFIFEQKASANQMRSTQAFEVAEAGLEWATAMLNNRGVINNACVPTVGQPNSFGGIYAPRSGTPQNYIPPTNARAGCRMAASGALTCSCPAAGGTVALGSSTQPNFTVLIEDTADIDAVRITSWGCINQTAACTATNNAGGDATASASVVVKLRPILRAAPAAALTTGGWAQVCGSFNITNSSQAANGYLVNSGGQTQIGNGTYLSGALPVGAPNCGGGGGQTLATTPGTPIAASIVANDTSLSTISGDSNAMFSAFFGTTLAQFIAAPSTCTISGSSATNRANNLIAAYNDGARRCRDFWVDGDIQFSGNATLGTAADPVTMVSASDMSFNGNYEIYGVIYSDSADWNDLGTGTSDIYGAVISRVNYRNNGNGSIRYDAGTLANIQDRGRLVRVPGTWRDFQ
ncbi:MAG: hypothetical protein HC793_03925 [Aquincola sp.]|nr:hypothetical protein [Aquincola sp.]